MTTATIVTPPKESPHLLSLDEIQLKYCVQYQAVSS